MSFFNTMKIKAKLWLLVAVFGFLFIVFAAIAFSTLNTLEVNGPMYQKIKTGQDLVADILPPPEYVIEAYLTALQMADSANRSQVPDLIQYFQKRQNEYDTRHQYWIDQLPQDTAKDLQIRDAMIKDSYDSAERFFSAANNKFIPAVQRGDYTTAAQLVHGELRQEYDTHRKAIDQVVSLSRAQNTQIEHDATSTIDQRTKTMEALGLGILLIVTLGVGWLLNRSISAALQQAANTLSSTSSQIASAIEEHERTAVHQSSAVHETTATMDELDASFRQTMEMVTTAADTARHATSVAEAGIQTVHKTRDGMVQLREKVGVIAEQILGLSEQTSQIGSITSLVSDLANQTNMLALNAAVEAARAGEHGKGFSVVAAEIRKLADESKKSAERINILVEDIQKATNSTVMATEEGTKNVEQGIRLAEETVQAFNMVAASSNSASEAAQQTLLSVPQQVTAVKQVLSAMDALNKGARETADGIGQTKVGVDDLRTTAFRLQEMI